MADALHFDYPYFKDQLAPKGELLVDKRCHACWFYYVLAAKNRADTGTGPDSQIIEVDPGLNTPLWMERRYHQIATTVALIYGLSSPDEFLPFFPVVEREARRHGFEIPPDILTPFMVGRA